MPKDFPTPRFAGLLFDMDGVLVDSEACIAEAAIRMFRDDFGVKVEVAEFAPFVGTGEARYLGGVAEAHGITLDVEAAKARTYGLYFEIIPGHLKEVRGARALVLACRERGIRSAVATSADRMKADANLRELGLSEADFDAVVTGLDVKRTKPWPDIYLEAATRIGLEPSACLVVEDAETGLRAGRAAGATCAGITTSFPAERLSAAGAHRCFADLAELAPWALGDAG
jgi:HAD superfamily hydrolase (TIGR01509 family)